MNTIVISPKEVLKVGATWKKTLNLVPKSGSLTISSVSHKLMARNTTTDLASSYITGSAAISGSQVTTGEVGTGTIPPGSYTYFLTVVTSLSSYVLEQDFEFVPMKGN